MRKTVPIQLSWIPATAVKRPGLYLLGRTDGSKNVRLIRVNSAMRLLLDENVTILQLDNMGLEWCFMGPIPMPGAALVNVEVRGNG
jgi:hypothetical protein